MSVTQNNSSTKFLAQAFSVATPGDVTGIYLTKIGLFYKAKANASTVRISVMEMSNGFPNRDAVVPNSSLVLYSEQVNVSSDASAETIFEFPIPLYLESTKQYCFSIQAQSPNFTLWGATRGERDITTNKIVNVNPLTENAFYSESDAEYSELPSQDIKFNLYRAEFTVGTRTVTLSNREYLHYIVLDEVTSVKNLSPVATDKLYRASPTDSGYSEYGRFVDMFKTDDGKTVILGEVPHNSDIEKDDILIMYRETVANGVTYKTELLTGIVVDTPAYQYHSVFPRLNVDLKPGTNMTLNLKGAIASGNSFALESDYNIPLSIDSESILPDQARYLLGSGAERDALSGNSSIQIQATLTATNDYVAPIIHFSGSHVALLSNIINNDLTNETTRDGAAKSKYISRIVALADGMDAEDLRVYVDAYKPKNTEITVYGKFQNAEDFSNFDDLPWLPLVQLTPSGVYSDPKDQTDYREFEFGIPDAYKTADGYFTYVGTGTQTGNYVRYKKYSIKIVLTTEEGFEFNPPKITDLRTIALQK